MVLRCKQKQTKVLDDRQNGKRKQSGPKKCKNQLLNFQSCTSEIPEGPLIAVMLRYHSEL